MRGLGSNARRGCSAPALKRCTLAVCAVVLHGDRLMSTSPSRMCLYWDFFGPNATGTAEHFRKHLTELFAAESIDDCELGLESKGRGHHAVWCRADAARAEDLSARLRPRRSAPVTA